MLVTLLQKGNHIYSESAVSARVDSIMQSLWQLDQVVAGGGAYDNAPTVLRLLSAPCGF